VGLLIAMERTQEALGVSHAVMSVCTFRTSLTLARFLSHGNESSSAERFRLPEHAASSRSVSFVAPEPAEVTVIFRGSETKIPRS
jgi:hypothetical protein